MVPPRKPDAHGVVAQVTPALSFALVGDGRNFLVTPLTDVHRQEGKRVPKVSPQELKAGQRVSVWVRGTDAEAVIIFPRDP